MIRRRTRLREQANSSYVSSSPPPSSTAQPSPVAHSNENNDSNGVNHPNSTPDTNTTATANSNTAVASTLRNRSTTTTSFTSNPTAHAFYGWMLLGPHVRQVYEQNMLQYIHMRICFIGCLCTYFN